MTRGGAVDYDRPHAARRQFPILRAILKAAVSKQDAVGRRIGRGDHHVMNGAAAGG